MSDCEHFSGPGLQQALAGGAAGIPPEPRCHGTSAARRQTQFEQTRSPDAASVQHLVAVLLQFGNSDGNRQYRRRGMRSRIAFDACTARMEATGRSQQEAAAMRSPLRFRPRHLLRPFYDVLDIASGARNRTETAIEECDSDDQSRQFRRPIVRAAAAVCGTSAAWWTLMAADSRRARFCITLGRDPHDMKNQITTITAATEEQQQPEHRFGDLQSRRRRRPQAPRHRSIEEYRHGSCRTADAWILCEDDE